jgi:hypothetical protein
MRLASSTAAVYVIGLMLIAAAPASAGFLSAETTPVALSGEGTEKQVMAIEGGLKVECKSASATGTLTEADSTVSMTPSFSGCTAFGLEATVTNTGCEFVYEIGAETKSETFTGTVDVVCSTGKALVVTAGTCEIQVSGQTERKSFEATNESEKTSVTVKTSLSEVTYNKTVDGFLCPLNGTGVKSDGSFTGTTHLTGSVGEVAAAIVLLPHTALCKINEDSCKEKNRHPTGLLFEGNAPKDNFKLEVNFDDGKGVNKTITITCEKSRITARANQYTYNAFTVSWTFDSNIETFTTETCKDNNGAACSTVDARETAWKGRLAHVANGNGNWKGPLKLRVKCTGPPINCDVGSKEITLEFEGNATNAVLKAPGVSLDWEKRGAGGGEENCGNKAAKLTVAYTLNIAGFLVVG